MGKCPCSKCDNKCKNVDEYTNQNVSCEDCFRDCVEITEEKEKGNE